MVGVVAHERGKVERHGEARLAVVEQELVALVRVLGRAEPRELPHRPQPAAVPRGMDPAGEGKLSGLPELARDVRSEEHTSELQSLAYLVCRLLLEKKKI